MYNYWINLAEPKGTTFDGAVKYVHVLTTKPMQDRAEAEYAATKLRLAFPHHKLTTYRQLATYEEI